MRIPTSHLGRLPLLLALAMAGCIPVHPQIDLDPVPFPTPRVSRSREFVPERYGSILVVPPEKREVGGTDALMGTVSYNEYVAMAQRLLMESGYRVIEHEVVARVEARLKQRRADTATGNLYTRAEKALVLARETSADALLVFSTLNDRASNAFYVQKENVPEFMRPATEVEAKAATQRLSCVYSTASRTFDFEAKLIDVATGDVLWIGASEISTGHIIPQRWTARLTRPGAACRLMVENFSLSDYLTRTSAARQQISNLIETVLRTIGGRRAPQAAPANTPRPAAPARPVAAPPAAAPPPTPAPPAPAPPAPAPAPAADPSALPPVTAP